MDRGSLPGGKKQKGKEHVINLDLKSGSKDTEQSGQAIEPTQLHALQALGQNKQQPDHISINIYSREKKDIEQLQTLNRAKSAIKGGKEKVIEQQEADIKSNKKIDCDQVPETTEAMLHKIEELLRVQQGGHGAGTSRLGWRELLLITSLYFLFPDKSSGTQQSSQEGSSPRDTPQAIKQLLEQIFKYWMNLQNNWESSRKREGICTIYRLPENTRMHNEKDYEPRAVPIGPYHHVHERLLFREMEAHKPQCIRYLLSLAPHVGKEVELRKKCIHKMKELENKARSCYSEDTSHMDSDHFSEVLLRDGCFIIYLLLDQQEKTNGREEANGSAKVEIDRPIIDTQKLNSIKIDLLKLENQIPFFIVQALFNLIKPFGMPPSSLVDLALKFFHDLQLTKPKTMPPTPSIDEVHHLLHLFHFYLAPSVDHMTSSGRWDMEDQCSDIAPTWIPSATELQESGVEIREKLEASSILDINFHNGRMEMPALCMYKSTTSLIRNLIAFEQSFPCAEAYITSYVMFINCLMHSEEDVRLLHLQAVVINKMSTDKEVAQFFKRICPQGPSASKPNYLNELFIKVTNHHAQKKNRWIAEGKRKYCSSPWVSLSVIVGFILLIFTFLQTVATIIQTIHDFQ